MNEPLSEDAATLAWYHQALRYAQRKGRPDAEDIAATMVLERLEHPDRPLAPQFAYMHALDRLDPRRGNAAAGTRHRTSATERALEGPQHETHRTVLERLPAPQDEHDPWAPALLARFLRRLAPRDAQLLQALYLHGQSQADMARAQGLTESTISQRVSQAEARLRHLLYLERRRDAPHQTHLPHL